MKIDINNLVEREVFNLIKNGGMDLDQFMEWCDRFAFDRVESYIEMKEFYDLEDNI